MKQYLFYDSNNEKTIFKYKSTYIWVPFAMMMFIMALIAAKEDLGISIFLVLAGLCFFPGTPLAIKYYKKAYYIQMEEGDVVCAGRISNLFKKDKIMYQDIGYVETGKKEPIIYPYGTTGKQLVSEFGNYVNVYDRDKKYMFSFRESAEITNKLLEKNPDIQLVEILKEYHV